MRKMRFTLEKIFIVKLKILLLLPLLVNAVFAQNRYSISEIQTTQEPSQFSNFIIDESNDKYIAVIKRDDRNYLSTGNGNVQLLDKYERCISFYQDIVTTINHTQNETILKIYNVLDNGITEIKSEILNVPFLNVEASIKNQSIVVNNSYEGIGSGFKIYSKNLNPIKLYQPFDDGFSQGHSGGNSQRTIIAANSLNYEKIKIGIFDNYGKILFENVLNSDYRVKKIYSFEQVFLIYLSGGGGNRKIIAVDNKGDLLWEEEYLLPYFQSGIEVLSDGSMLYFISDVATISVVQIHSGKLDHKIELSTFIDVSKKKKSRTNHGTRVSDFKLVGGTDILVSLGDMVWDGSNSHTFQYSNPITLIMTPKGLLKDRIQSLGEYTSFKFINSKPSGFSIISEKNITRYEK